MPHIVIEYSQNVSEQVHAEDILQVMQEKVSNCGLFSPDAVKTRGTAFDAGHYCLPEGASSFIHVTVSILSGRTTEERSSLSETLFNVLQTQLPDVDKKSVNIHEMDKSTYRK